MSDDITPEILLQAYAAGVFPMSESRDDPDLFWVDPDRRGILPLDGFHISRSLARTLRQDRYSIRINSAFSDVVAACAERDVTWISDRIHALYLSLHHMGHAHSLEVWSNRELVGGVYGVTLGAAFFGESMFSRVRDASKIALAYLVQQLRADGFSLFDTQFITSHLASLGGMEINRSDYRDLLEKALQIDAGFGRSALPHSGQDVIQRNTQIS